MTKRFIDSDMWELPEFMEADPKKKLLGIFMLSRCDHAGIFRFNASITRLILGFPVSEKDILDIPFNIRKISDFHYWLEKFCLHQYGPLKSGCYPHMRVAERLAGLGLLGFVSVHKDSDFSHLTTLPPTLVSTLPTTLKTTPEDEDEYKDEDKDEDVLTVFNPKEDKSNTVPAREKRKEAISAITDAIWKASPPICRQRSSTQQLRKALEATEPPVSLEILPSILEGIGAWKVSAKWLAEDGQFQDGIHKWVKYRQWENIPDRLETATEKMEREHREFYAKQEVK